MVLSLQAEFASRASTAYKLQLTEKGPARGGSGLFLYYETVKISFYCKRF